MKALVTGEVQRQIQCTDGLESCSCYIVGEGTKGGSGSSTNLAHVGKPHQIGGRSRELDYWVHIAASKVVGLGTAGSCAGNRVSLGS